MLHLQDLGSSGPFLHIRLDITIVLVIMVLNPVFPKSALLKQVRDLAFLAYFKRLLVILHGPAPGQHIIFALRDLTNPLIAVFI